MTWTSPPRWVRVTIRVALAAFTYTALPLSFEDFNVYGSEIETVVYRSLLLLAGVFIIALCLPLLGPMTAILFLAIFYCVLGTWLAFGLFMAWNNTAFLTVVTVLLTAVVFFGGTYREMLVPILAIFPVMFICNMYILLRIPAHVVIALPIIMTAGMFVAIPGALLLNLLVFPEYTTDEVLAKHELLMERVDGLACKVFAKAPKPTRHPNQHYITFKFLPKVWQNIYNKDPQGAFRVLELLAQRQEQWEQKKGRWKLPASPAQDAEAQQGQGGKEAEQAQQQHQLEVEAPFWAVQEVLSAAAGSAIFSQNELYVGQVAGLRLFLPWGSFPIGPKTGKQLPHYPLFVVRSALRGLSYSLQRLSLVRADPPAGITMPLLVELLSSPEYEAAGAALVAAVQEMAAAFPMRYKVQGRLPRLEVVEEYGDAVEQLIKRWQPWLVSPSRHQEQQQHQPQQQQQGEGRRMAYLPGMVDAWARGRARMVLQQLHAAVRQLQELHAAVEAVVWHVSSHVGGEKDEASSSSRDWKGDGVVAKDVAGGLVDEEAGRADGDSHTWKDGGDAVLFERDRGGTLGQQQGARGMDDWQQPDVSKREAMAQEYAAFVQDDVGAGVRPLSQPSEAIFQATVGGR